MIKGAQAKEEITKKILETFSGSFKYDKEIRIPWTENGEAVQIKITVTAAKTAVRQGEDEAMLTERPIIKNAAAPINEEIVQSNASNIEVSADEKENLSKLLRSLGL